MQRAADWVALSLAKGLNGNVSNWPDGKASQLVRYSCMRRLREHSRRAGMTRDPFSPIRGAWET